MKPAINLSNPWSLQGFKSPALTYFCVLFSVGGAVDVCDCLIQRNKKKILETISKIYFLLMASRVGTLGSF